MARTVVGRIRKTVALTLVGKILAVALLVIGRVVGRILVVAFRVTGRVAAAEVGRILMMEAWRRRRQSWNKS